MKGKLNLYDDMMLMAHDDGAPDIDTRLRTFVNALFEAQHDEAEQISDEVERLIEEWRSLPEPTAERIAWWQKAYELEETLAGMMPDLAPRGFRWVHGAVLNSEAGFMGWVRVGGQPADQRQLEYVESGGSKCPYCGSESFTAGSLTVDGGAAGQKVWCDECDRSWYDEYVLTGFTPGEDDV